MFRTLGSHEKVSGSNPSTRNLFSAWKTCRPQPSGYQVGSTKLYCWFFVCLVAGGSSDVLVKLNFFKKPPKRELPKEKLLARDLNLVRLSQLRQVKRLLVLLEWLDYIIFIHYPLTVFTAVGQETHYFSPLTTKAKINNFLCVRSVF